MSPYAATASAIMAIALVVFLIMSLWTFDHFSIGVLTVAALVIFLAVAGSR